MAAAALGAERERWAHMDAKLRVFRTLCSEVQLWLAAAPPDHEDELPADARLEGCLHDHRETLHLQPLIDFRRARRDETI